jgi:hypothetical protein
MRKFFTDISENSSITIGLASGLCVTIFFIGFSYANIQFRLSGHDKDLARIDATQGKTAEKVDELSAKVQTTNEILNQIKFEVKNIHKNTKKEGAYPHDNR